MTPTCCKCKRWIGCPLTSWCWNAARITLPLFSWKYISVAWCYVNPSTKLYAECIFTIGDGNMVSSEQHHWYWSGTILAVWWWVVSHHIIIIVLLTILHHLNCYPSYSASRHLVYFTTVFDVFKYWKQSFWIWNHRTVSWIFS